MATANHTPATDGTVAQILRDACKPTRQGIRTAALISLIDGGYTLDQALELDHPPDRLLDHDGQAAVDAWLDIRGYYPPGPMLCGIRKRNLGERLHVHEQRAQLREVSARTGRGTMPYLQLLDETDRHVLDARGQVRSRVTLPGHNKGRPNPRKGRVYPPEPFVVEDVVAILQACPDTPHGRRLRALVVLLWRSGLRIFEALALVEQDLDDRQKLVHVRCGKGGKSRTVAMDEWGWTQLRPWLTERRNYPPGALFCVLDGPTAGRPWSDSNARHCLRQAGERAGLRRRCNPHALRHTLAVEMRREGMDVYTVQQQLGHARLDVTQRYLVGIDRAEVLAPVIGRRAPVMPLPRLAA